LEHQLANGLGERHVAERVDADQCMMLHAIANSSPISASLSDF